MVKVAHFINGLQVGGAEMMLYNTVTHMNAHPFSPIVISLSEKGPVGEMVEQAGINVIALNEKSDIPSIKIIWRLRDILAEQKVDILQTYLYKANFYGLIVGQLARVPVVWGLYCSDMDFRLYHPLSGLAFQLNRLLSGFPAIIVANSEAGRQYHISKGYDGRRMVVVPNGFELERFQPDESCRLAVRDELGIPRESILIGLIGRFDPMKDHRTFVRAAGQIANRHKDIYFLLAGEGIDSSNPVLTKYVDEAHLQGKTFLLGRRDDMPRIMASLDILVSSSVSEGFPLVLGEAMACGVPCVVTDVGDSAPVVGDTGVVVPPCDAEALARGMERLIIIRPEERRRLGEAARWRVEENYDITTVVKRLEKLYIELIDKHNINKAPDKCVNRE